MNSSSMTTANKVTILRILLVPFFTVNVLYYFEDGDEVNRFLALVSFAVAAISDAVDGYIARRYHQHSELGAVLDPLADKLLLVSAILLLSLPHQPFLPRLPLYLVATVFGRDLIVILGSGVIYYFNGRVTIRPRWLGKIATVFQMLAVTWALLKWNPAWIPWWSISAAICTGVSGLFYVNDGINQLSANPSSSPKPQN